MLRFTFHDTSKVVVRAMCPKHSRYNPAADGDGGIVGGLLDLPTDISGLDSKAESRIRNPRPPSYRRTLDANQTRHFSISQTAKPHVRLPIGAETVPSRNKPRPARLGRQSCQ